ncbi:MAG: hydratase, partial [Acutalibacteraceae bacterium]
SRKDPQYVGRAKSVYAKELERRATAPDAPGLGSLVFALRPGDGSAREQAASCQRVLGGVANIALEYATRRYRANVVNWGMLPFILPDAETYNIQPGDVVKLRGIRKALEAGLTEIPATLVQPGGETALQLQLPQMTDQERDIILAGCLMNYYAAQNKKAE